MSEINFEQNEDALVERMDDLAVEAKSNPETPKFKVKPAIKIPSQNVTTPGEDVIKAAEQQQAAFRNTAKTQGSSVIDGMASMDSIRVKPNNIADFSQMTEDDVYNLDIPMEARPFSSEDSLKVSLMDSGYVPRWVNKDPRRLGSMKSRGFSYVTEKDLRENLEVEVSADAEGHFSLGDVILMKIPKERYFAALRAAHLRALATVGPKGAHRAALSNINEYMSKETHGAYREEAEAGKVAFYTPGISI